MKLEDHEQLQRNYVPKNITKEDEVAQKRKESREHVLKLIESRTECSGFVRHVKTHDNGDLNFAFITPNDSMVDDIFVHHKEVEPWRNGFKKLHVDEIVKFKIDFGNKEGTFQAVNLEIIREGDSNR